MNGRRRPRVLSQKFAPNDSRPPTGRGSRISVVVASLFGISTLMELACASSETTSASPIDGGVDHVRANPGIGAPTTPASTSAPAPLPLPLGDASCNVVVASPSLVPANHLPESTPIAYTSNPPSSGPHYPRWANFQEFAEPVVDGYLVHSMEHGAVLLLYKCEPSACASTLAMLRAVRDSIATDPACDPSIRVRIVLAPRPTLDVPVAAAAWGFTYRADCVDVPSLTQFVRDHYAKGPEDFCAPGVTTF